MLCYNASYTIGRLLPGGIYLADSVITLLQGGGVSVVSNREGFQTPVRWSHRVSSLFVEFDDGEIACLSRSARRARSDIFVTVGAGQKRWISRNYSGGKLGIAIATCPEYREATVPQLVDQLLSCGVPADDILVCCGQAPEPQAAMYCGVAQISTPVRAWEYAALQALSIWDGTADRTHWFLLHDTCEVEQGFWEAATAVPVIHGSEIVYADVDPIGAHCWCNLGAYSADWLYAHRKYLTRLHEIPKLEGVGVELDWHALGLHRASLCTTTYVGCTSAVTENVPYLDGFRNLRYYPHLHLKKYWSSAGYTI